MSASPTQLWRAFEAVEAAKVKGSGGEMLTDLVNLVDHALIPNLSLVPYRDELRERYQAWLRSAIQTMPLRPSSANGLTGSQSISRQA